MSIRRTVALLLHDAVLGEEYRDVELQLRDRGQLILLTALVVGFLLIGLVTVFGSGIVVEKLESEPVTNDPATVKETRYSTRHMTRLAILRMNNKEYGASTPSTVNQTLKNMSEQLEVNVAESRNTMITMENVNVTEGQSIRQRSRSEITDKNGNVSWTAGTFESARRFRFDVQREDLPNIGNNRLRDANFLEANTFYILFEGQTGGTYRVFIYRHGGDIHLTRQLNGSQPTTTAIETDRARIGIITGEFNNNPVYDFPTEQELHPPYTVKIRNGDQADAVYMMTGRGTVNRTAVARTPGRGSPYDTTIAYKVAFTLRYLSPSINMETDMTVKPCSSRDFQCPAAGNAENIP